MRRLLLARCTLRSASSSSRRPSRRSPLGLALQAAQQDLPPPQPPQPPPPPTPLEPPANADLEATLVDWLKVQRVQWDRIDKMRSSRRAREDAIALPGEDPYPYRVRFFKCLEHSDLLFLTQEDHDGKDLHSRLQLFSTGGDQLTFCVFTSLQRCEQFAERLSQQFLEAAEHPEEDEECEADEEFDPTATPSQGALPKSLVLVGSNGKKLEVPASIEGTWLPASEALHLLCAPDKDNDPLVAKSLRVHLNPFNGEENGEVVLPYEQVRMFCEGRIYTDYLRLEVELVFKAFFEEFTPEVSKAWLVWGSAVPNGRRSADDLVLIMESTDYRATLGMIGWTKSNTAVLESSLTTFSMLYLHERKDFPEAVEGVTPFYTRPQS